MGGVGLRDLDLKSTYDSDTDDILGDFYIPALAASVAYQRLAGFFSSSALAVAARGVSEFVRNGGRMKLVCGARLSAQDVQAISEAVVTPEQVVERVGIQDLSSLEDHMLRDHVGALGWMIARGDLSIKVALVVDETGRPLDETAVSQEGIFHQKVGILQDARGDLISFSGSDNETASAWTRHIEEFKVFRQWEISEEPYLRSDAAKFAKFWEAKARRTRVFDIPEAVAGKMIEMAPRGMGEVDLPKWRTRWLAKERRSTVGLWEHQRTAVEKWFENGRRGIMEMATGTGKTFVALECIKRCFEESKGLVAVLAFPYSHLLRQWIGDLAEYGIDSASVVVDSSNPEWRSELPDLLIDVRLGHLPHAMVLTTHDSLSAEDLTTLIREHSKSTMLVVDEVHGVGAPSRQRGLLDTYMWRLGLSATPDRWFDAQGTAVIREFFGETVFRFTLRDAITTVNPATRESFLTPYLYRPCFVDLSSDEAEEYLKLSEKISRIFLIAKKSPEYEASLEMLLFKRQRILNNAVGKIDALSRILSELNNVSHCLIYCSPQQVGTVQDLLNARGIAQHKFTMEEGVVPSTRFRGMSQREYLLRGFAEDTIKVLVAMKCLDEGVDVPPARIGVILASTSNPREFIQRRGRLLRRFPGKKAALIYDLVTVPPWKSISKDPELVKVEKQILRKEMARFLEFAEDAKNSVECLDLLERFGAGLEG